MLKNRSEALLGTILTKVELPQEVYERVDKRYKDLGEWLHRPDSSCVEYDPRVFPQGSFRLGTAIKPDSDEEYDLDLGCNLRDGLSKDLITQEQLKAHIGNELELYRNARGIKEELVEKRRCWRLEYADGLSFHMDIVPCIPEGDSIKYELKKRMIESSRLGAEIAQVVSELAVCITDKNDPGFRVMTESWRVSNPEGYARWFESRMKMAQEFIAERERTVEASIDSLPYYRWKTPLQQAIQLLKRHRDTMFKDDQESKPISVIITTLAARAYKGETDLVAALSSILSSMDGYVNDVIPYVPNPVNPKEDFADKWYDEKLSHIKLRENFYKWSYQARADFKAILAGDSGQVVGEAISRGLDVRLDVRSIVSAMGLEASAIKPAREIQLHGPKPWFKQ